MSIDLTRKIRNDDDDDEPAEILLPPPCRHAVIRRKRRVPLPLYSVNDRICGNQKVQGSPFRREDQNKPSYSSQEAMGARVSVVLHHGIVIT